MTLDQMLEYGASDPALPVITTAERIALSQAISARRQADDAASVGLRDRLAIAAIGELSGRLLDGREERSNSDRNKAVRRLVRDAYAIADQALLERVK